jgi:ATPase subunit of ABC transporter with duplicated ATPase domains
MATDAEVDAAIEKVLERCGTLDMFKNRRSFPQGFDTRKNARDMSGGQVRGVGLARALFREPRILLLDEPTNDLDPDVQQVGG